MCSTSLLVYSHSLFLKLWTALLMGPVENCPIPSPVRLSIQKLFLALNEAFKKLWALLCKYDIFRWGFKIGKLGDWHPFSIICELFVCRHCWMTIQCVCSPMIWFSLNLLLCLSAVGCNHLWTLKAKINKHLYILFAEILILKLPQVWWQHDVELVLLFIEINDN